MLKLNAVDFYKATTALFEVQIHLNDLGNGDESIKPEDAIDDDLRNFINRHGKSLKKALTTLNAKVTELTLDELLLRTENGFSVTYDDVRKSFSGIDATLRRELSLVSTFVMDTGKVQYFEPKNALFGELVEFRISPATLDIEEAGKCLALGRGTAAVFHLMRVMEAGLKELAKLLGIPYAPSWESYIKKIGDKIGEKHQTKGIDWKKDEPFYRDILGDLQSIKIVWRNPTMHIVNQYTPDQAEDIYRAVRSFLQRLAPRLPESFME